MSIRKCGRKPGFGNYRADVLLNIIEDVKPTGISAWNEVAERYMHETGESGLRPPQDMRRHFNQSLCNSGKLPKENSPKLATIMRAQAIYANIWRNRRASHPHLREMGLLDSEHEMEHDGDPEMGRDSSVDSNSYSSASADATENENATPRNNRVIDSFSAHNTTDNATLPVEQSVPPVPGSQSQKNIKTASSMMMMMMGGGNKRPPDNYLTHNHKLAKISPRAESEDGGHQQQTHQQLPPHYTHGAAYDTNAEEMMQTISDGSLLLDCFHGQPMANGLFVNVLGAPPNPVATTGSSSSAANNNCYAGMNYLSHLEMRLAMLERELKREIECRKEDRSENEKKWKEERKLDELRRREERLENERLRLEERRLDEERRRQERAEYERLRGEDRRLDEERRREERMEFERIRKEDYQRNQLLLMTLLKGKSIEIQNGLMEGNIVD